MRDEDVKLSMAYWDQSPNCPAHYNKALNLYLEHKDTARVGMTPRNFVRVLEKGLAKAKFMGLEPAKVIKSKAKGGKKVKKADLSEPSEATSPSTS